MARVTHVKRAQQRYETEIVRDENGDPVRTPVMNRRTGKQKVTKRGALVFVTQTRENRSKPKPNRKCDKCGKEIKVGDGYKWIKPKSGPYGGTLKVRCTACPTWNVWDYSYSLSAQTARIEHDFSEAIDSAESTDDVQSALDDAAAAINEIAEAKREGASNIEDGFGHPTSASEELEQVAEELEGWAQEVESADVPEYPEIEDEDCETCDGTGKVDSDDESDEKVDCDDCDGTGQFTPDEADEGQVEDWREECRDLLGDCPV